MERSVGGYVVLRGVHVTTREALPGIEAQGLKQGYLGMWGQGVYAANILAPATLNSYLKYWWNGWRGRWEVGEHDRIALTIQVEVPAEEVVYLDLPAQELRNQYEKMGEDYVRAKQADVVVIGSGVQNEGIRSGYRPDYWATEDTEPDKYGSLNFDVGQWRVNTNKYQPRIVKIEELPNG